MVSSLRPSVVRGRPVSALLDRLDGAHLTGDDPVVTGITHDSRDARSGDLYIARGGERTHGIAHVGDALRSGAVAVLTDRASVPAARSAGATSVIDVDDPRAVAGPAAAWVYDDPASALTVIGITGTNGKTTTAYFVEAGLRAAGRATALVGTVETRIGDEVLPSVRTTPEATDLQALFAVMRERSVVAVAMEVSSHALALDRVAGTRFAVAAFTNLSHDHLDFHRDMEDYFAAKALLFTAGYAARGVVTIDDEWGRRLAASAGIPVETLGASGADWALVDEEVSATGGHVSLRAPDGAAHRIAVGLPGHFNLRNAALAFVTLRAAGVDEDAARSGIEGLTAVPGRMERVDAGQPFVALVDYAHTPDAVSTLLDEARVLAGDRRVVIVLGCGGDRDRAKRGPMGVAAARGADVVVLTSDNPRSEDPDAILAAMLDGTRSVATDSDILVEPDRRRAIDLAVSLASAGDVVVVAGKGHETGQERDGQVVPFDDREVLRAALLRGAS